MLGDFSGTLMTDGYAVYAAVAKTNDLTHLVVGHMPGVIY
ncbi:IS66 family transposase [Colwellia psychrerythraea]